MNLPKITVTALRDEGKDGEEGYWRLAFAFLCEGGLRFTFTAEEPYCFSKKQWLDLALGKGGLNLYAGNGEGSIIPDGEHLRFTANPSGSLDFIMTKLQGSGGDVCAKFGVPLDLITKPLTEAIEDAAAKGLRFSKK